MNNVNVWVFLSVCPPAGLVNFLQVLLLLQFFLKKTKAERESVIRNPSFWTLYFSLQHCNNCSHTGSYSILLGLNVISASHYIGPPQLCLHKKTSVTVRRNEDVKTASLNVIISRGVKSWWAETATQLLFNMEGVCSGSSTSLLHTHHSLLEQQQVVFTNT